MNKIGSIKRLTKELSKKYAQDEEATKTLDEVVSFFPGFKFMFSLVFFVHFRVSFAEACDGAQQAPQGPRQPLQQVQRGMGSW